MTFYYRLRLSYSTTEPDSESVAIESVCTVDGCLTERVSNRFVLNLADSLTDLDNVSHRVGAADGELVA